jgi:NAD(P)-dependent dehydrogenase (short-subunit alcohol dehydrogenase family)
MSTTTTSSRHFHDHSISSIIVGRRTNKKTKLGSLRLKYSSPSSSTTTSCDGFGNDSNASTRREILIKTSAVLSLVLSQGMSEARANDDDEEQKNERKKVILITGANSGIGKTCAVELARLGHTVILHARTKEKQEKIGREIVAKQEDADVVLCGNGCDLNDLREVREYSERVLEYLSSSSSSVEEGGANGSRMKKIDALILNAGIMAAPLEYTQQGHESHFGINHLAHYLLYENLKPALFVRDNDKAGEPARVISVSSLLCVLADFSFDANDLDFRLGRKYGKWEAYAQSKACNVLMMDDLAERNDKSKLVANSFHPGIVTTDLVRYSFPNLIASKRDPEKEKWIREQAHKLGLRDADEGCKTHVWLATSDEALKKTGEFFVDPGLIYPGATHKELVSAGDWFLVSGEEPFAKELNFPNRLFDWRNESNRVKLREISKDMVSDFLL